MSGPSPLDQQISSSRKQEQLDKAAARIETAGAVSNLVRGLGEGSRTLQSQLETTAFNMYSQMASGFDMAAAYGKYRSNAGVQSSVDQNQLLSSSDVAGFTGDVNYMRSKMESDAYKGVELERKSLQNQYDDMSKWTKEQIDQYNESHYKFVPNTTTQTTNNYAYTNADGTPATFLEYIGSEIITGIENTLNAFGINVDIPGNGVTAEITGQTTTTVNNGSWVGKSYQMVMDELSTGIAVNKSIMDNDQAHKAYVNFMNDNTIFDRAVQSMSEISTATVDIGTSGFEGTFASRMRNSALIVREEHNRIVENFRQSVKTSNENIQMAIANMDLETAAAEIKANIQIQQAQMENAQRTLSNILGIIGGVGSIIASGKQLFG